MDVAIRPDGRMGIVKPDLTQERRFQVAKEFYIHAVLDATVDYKATEIAEWAFDLADVFIAELDRR